MSKLKLDKGRAYGTVHGEGVKHAYEQDGLPFSSDGELMEDLLNEEQKKIAAKRLKKVKAISKPGPATQGQPAPAGEDDDDDDGDNDAVNFEEWLKGNLDYEPRILFDVAKARYSKVFSTKKALAEFLVFEEQVVTPEEVMAGLLDAA